MKTFIFLLFLPFFSKAQTGMSTGLQLSTNSRNIYVGALVGTIPTDSVNTYVGCCAVTPTTLEWKSDTVKMVMLVSDTSMVERPYSNIAIGHQAYNDLKVYKMQDTRPYMAYGYQTSTGEILDAYKQRLSKNIIMWIAYKTK